MSIKSSLNKVSNIRLLLLIFLIITKRECWPVFKQDPKSATNCEMGQAKSWLKKLRGPHYWQ